MSRLSAIPRRKDNYGNNERHYFSGSATGGADDPHPATDTSPVADSAMATGTDDEPEMTIADKHSGETIPDQDGDGELTSSEAATLLGDDTNQSKV